MGGLELRDPVFLALGLLAPVVYWLASRTSSRVRYSSLALVAQATDSWRAKLLPLPPLSLALATLAIAVAMAGPRTGDATTQIHREGIAIVMHGLLHPAHTDETRPQEDSK